MKRRMNKRMATAALAGAMVLSMNGMAWAAVDEFDLTKEVTTDGNTHAPNTAFSFTITEGDASTFEGAKVSAGVKGGLTLDAANDFSFAPGDEVSASYTKTGKIKVDATKFTKPGVYHYIVTEKQGTYDGITYDVTPRHVYVYVINGDTEGTYVVDSVKVVKDGDTAKADNLKIVNIYGDKDNPDKDNVHDFIIKKTVTGNQGDKNMDFSFTVTINGDDKDKADKEMYKAVKTPKAGEEEIIHIKDEEAATFTLKDGETLHIYGLSKQDAYTVAETDYTADGYTTIVKDENATGQLEADGVVVEFINDKNVGPATGVAMTFAPYVLLVAAAGGLGAVVLGKKKREDDEI